MKTTTVARDYRYEPPCYILLRMATTLPTSNHRTPPSSRTHRAPSFLSKTKTSSPQTSKQQSFLHSSLLSQGQIFSLNFTPSTFFPSRHLEMDDWGSTIVDNWKHWETCNWICTNSRGREEGNFTSFLLRDTPRWFGIHRRIWEDMQYSSCQIQWRTFNLNRRDSSSSPRH